MKSKWFDEKENLEQMILKDKLSYEEIGKKYGCSGGNIRKVARLIGIELPVRSSNRGKAPANKGTGKKYYCLNCGKELNVGARDNKKHKYCSNACQLEYEHNLWVEEYKRVNQENPDFATVGKKWKQMSSHLRRYIFDKYENKCCICGWSKVNPYTNTLPLEIDHIDGDASNNREDNLRLICPNCHSLTENYRGANKGNGRNITWLPNEVLEELKNK